jgi:putative pyruvate formate lyase activating enzyme
METQAKVRENVEKLVGMLGSCGLCPRRCGVNRLNGERGTCGSGSQLEVSSYGPHFGEEPELVGVHGSGTIFLTHCGLRCVYCQNYEISHLGVGEEASVDEASDMMLHLESNGCHNINLVTPTHYAPQLAEAILCARGLGLSVPIVWNCGGYESVDVIRLLEGLVEIYMPDVKYGEAGPATRYSTAPDYFDRAKECVLEMQRQVGDLKIDGGGLAYRGLIVRHLVLPDGLAGSERVLDFLAGEVSRDCYVNIMGQYRPCGKARDYPEIGRRTTSEEYRKVVEYASGLGLYRGIR